MKKITIIGGGASGTLLAINLMKLAEQDIEINLVDRLDRMGRGVAFGTTQATHLLNVPAGRMGAFHDEPDHFYRWLRSEGFDYAANDFVPRVLFGKYLRALFGELADEVALNTTVRINVLDDEAVDMSVNASSAEVMLRSGEILQSDFVVLAFGNFKPPHPSVPDLGFTASSSYFQDPWSSRLYESISSDQSVFVVGTGLSMVDVALELQKRGHRGKISAVSTRGLLPAVHDLGISYSGTWEEIMGEKRITSILKTVRSRIHSARGDQVDWRGVIDSLRPVTQQVWQDLPLSERRYFKQHLSRYWNVARHRMPPEAAAALDTMRSEGKLEILTGRLTNISIREGLFTSEFSSPHGMMVVQSELLVNCIGSEANFARIDTEFVRNLIRRQHIRPDPLALGIDATRDGRVVAKDDRPSNVVRTLGTSLRGILWETTAIPEIRMQAHKLALNLISN